MTFKLSDKPCPFTWYEDYYPSLYQLVYSQVNCSALTQDILQELYFKLNKIPSLSEISNPKNYLMQIACRLVIDNKRLKANQVETGQEQVIGLVVCPKAKPEHHAIQANLIEKVQTTLNKLPDEKRDLIWLSAVEGWNYQKIAKHKGRSLSWVEKSIAQGMALLTEVKRQSIGEP